MKQGLIWTGFAVIVTIISGNLIEMLIEYSYLIGLGIILISAMLFEAYMIYRRYRGEYQEKMDEFTKIIEKTII